MGRMGRYELVQRLAAGGMAEVFLARVQEGTGAGLDLVVKRILPHLASNPEFIEMFLNEAKLSVALHHPNVVRSFDLGCEAGAYFLCMEYVDGPSLRTVIRAARERGQRVPLAVALKIASLALAGLGHAHAFCDAQGNPLRIVHRDISPHNLLLSKRGEVKVADFGIAKAASVPSVTKTGQIKGKLRYMAPEQLLSEPLDARTDLFALGVTLFECVAGRRPFDADSDLGTAAAILNVPTPTLPRELAAPPELQQILERALAKAPADRYPDAASMRSDLDLLIEKLGVPADAAAIAAFIASLDSPLVPAPAAPQISEAAPPSTQLARRRSGARAAEQPESAPVSHTAATSAPPLQVERPHPNATPEPTPHARTPERPQTQSRNAPLPITARSSTARRGRAVQRRSSTAWSWAGALALLGIAGAFGVAAVRRHDRASSQLSRVEVIVAPTVSTSPAKSAKTANSAPATQPAPAEAPPHTSDLVAHLESTSGRAASRAGAELPLPEQAAPAAPERPKQSPVLSPWRGISGSGPLILDFGQLQLFTRRALFVEIDGFPCGSTPSGLIPLLPGEHRVKLTGTHRGYERVYRVEIRAGTTTTLRLES